MLSDTKLSPWIYCCQEVKRGAALLSPLDLRHWRESCSSTIWMSLHPNPLLAPTQSTKFPRGGRCCPSAARTQRPAAKRHRPTFSRLLRSSRRCSNSSKEIFPSKYSISSGLKPDMAPARPGLGEPCEGGTASVPLWRPPQPRPPRAFRAAIAALAAEGRADTDLGEKM